MNKSIRSILALSLALVAAYGTLAQTPSTTSPGPYRVSKILSVAGVGTPKYWDYLNLDQDTGRLFASLGNHFGVIDSATGKLVGDVTGMNRNHGVALVPSVGRGFISDGDDAVVVVFDLKTYQVLGKIKVEEDADGIQFDPATNKVWVVSGDGNSISSIAVDVDVTTGTAGAPIALGGKPEFFQMDNQGKAYVNLTDKNEVVVVDTKAGKVIARYPAAPGGANTAMAIDREHHLLFLGCRNPQKLVVMDATDGHVISDMPIGVGCDATAYDDGYAFAACRDGTLTIARETSPGKWTTVQTVATRTWAGTIAVDSKTHTAYLPTAEFERPLTSFARLEKGVAVKPDSFMIVVVARSGK
jgi:DNA-binding beta-propeller fold protein YncE